MSKFLEGIEENTPEKDIDKLTAGKRALQRLLASKGIKADAKVFQDTINVTLEDGSVVKLEVLDFVAPIEDQEMALGDALGAVASIPDQGIKGLAGTGRQLKQAKNKMAKAANAIADKMLKAAQGK